MNRIGGILIVYTMVRGMMMVVMVMRMKMSMMLMLKVLRSISGGNRGGRGVLRLRLRRRRGNNSNLLLSTGSGRLRTSASSLLLLLLREYRRHFGILFGLLLEVNFGVTLLLVAARELPPAYIARERLLAGMRANVRGEVIGARERTHANTTLEWFLAGVNAYMSGELVGAREPPVAILHRAPIRSFVYRRLTRPVRIFPRLHRHQLQRQRRLLVRLLQYLVPFTGGGVVLGQLNVTLTGAGRRLHVHHTDAAAAGDRRAVVGLLLWYNDAGRARHAQRGTGRILDRRVHPLVFVYRRILHHIRARRHSRVHQLLVAGGSARATATPATRVRRRLLNRYVAVAALDA